MPQNHCDEICISYQQEKDMGESYYDCFRTGENKILLQPSLISSSKRGNNQCCANY